MKLIILGRQLSLEIILIFGGKILIQSQFWQNIWFRRKPRTLVETSGFNTTFWISVIMWSCAIINYVEHYFDNQSSLCANSVNDTWLVCVMIPLNTVHRAMFRCIAPLAGNVINLWELNEKKMRLIKNPSQISHWTCSSGAASTASIMWQKENGAQGKESPTTLAAPCGHEGMSADMVFILDCLKKHLKGSSKQNPAE